MKIGDFEKFCEIQIKLGKWEKALSFAPAVSYEYWQKLIEESANNSLETDPEESAFLYMISNKQSQVLELFKIINIIFLRQFKPL